MKYMTIRQIENKKSDNAEQEYELFEGVSHEVVSARVDKVKDTLREYLSATKLNGGSIVDCLLTELLDCNYDVGSKVWGLEYSSIDYIKLLTSKEVSAVIPPAALESVVEFLYKINRFAARLKEEYCQAELNLAFIEYDGVGHLQSALRVEQDYLNEIKKFAVEAA